MESGVEVDLAEVAEFREGFGGRPGWWSGGSGERENGCKERGKDGEAGPGGVLGGTLGGLGLSEFYVAAIRTPAKPP